MPKPRGSLLSNRNYMLLLSGQSISVLGDFFGIAALSIAVYQLTGSAIGLAFNWTIFFIPRSAMRLLGGVLVDRLDRRRIMLLTESVRGALFATLAYAALSAQLSIWLVFGVSALVGTLGALFQMANDALLPSIVVATDDLVRANSYFSGSAQAATVLGWALAGLSISLYGVGPALALDSGSFFVLVLALAFIRVGRSEKQILQLRGAFLRNLREGFAFFKERRELLWLSLFFTCINFFLAPFWNVYILPFSDATIHSGPTGFGLLNAVETIGLTLGSLTMGRIGFVRRRRAYTLGSMFAAGCGIIAFGFTLSLLASLLAIVFVGFVIPFANIVEIALFQELVPNQLRGRVFGLKDFFSFVAQPLGLIFGGLLSRSVPLSSAIFISGASVALIAAASGLIPSFKKLDVGPSG